MAGSVEAICVSQRKGTVKAATPRARLRRDHGIEGDAHAGAGHRQVSILGLGEVESFKRKSGLRLRAGAFAENLIISGDELGSLGLGSHIRVGDTAVLAITQLGKQCHHHCAIFHQTGDCIMPRVGLFARVVEGGDIEVGAKTEVLTIVERSRPQAVVLTLGDRCSTGPTTDTTGPAVASLLRDSLAAHVYKTEVLRDVRAGLAERLRHYSDGHGIDLVVAVGDAAPAARDGTPDAVREVVDSLPARLVDVMRPISFDIRGSTLILVVTGSEPAATDSLRGVLPALSRWLAKRHGERGYCGHPSP